jgi:hypothetical protein
MTEQEFQELSRALFATQGLSLTKARLAATWTLAAHGFVANAVDYLPHLIFVGSTKVPRDRAVLLVFEAIKGLFVELTPAVEGRGIIRIQDYDELSKEDAENVRDLLLRPEALAHRPVLMGCGSKPSFPDSMPGLIVRFDERS